MAPLDSELAPPVGDGGYPRVDNSLLRRVERVVPDLGLAFFPRRVLAASGLCYATPEVGRPVKARRGFRSGRPCAARHPAAVHSLGINLSPRVASTSQTGWTVPVDQSGLGWETSSVVWVRAKIWAGCEIYIHIIQYHNIMQ